MSEIYEKGKRVCVLCGTYFVALYVEVIHVPPSNKKMEI